MKNSKAVYVLILGILICSACSSERITAATPSPALTASEAAAAGPVQIKATPDVEEQWFKKLYIGAITCDEYVSSVWKDEKDQVHSSPTLFLDRESNLYLLDRVNQRIVIYDGKTATPIALIDIPEEFATNFDPSGFHDAAFSVSVYQGNLYIPNDQGEIGVMDRTGKIISRVTVPEKYHVHPITQILIDVKEGLFLIDDSHLGYYFAPGWQEGNWKLVSASSSGRNVDLKSAVEYGDYLVGINASGEYPYPALTIYSLSDDGDFLESPLLFSVVYPDNLKNIHEMAMNEAGEFYTLHDFNEDWYVLAKKMISSYDGEGGFIDKEKIPNVSSMAVTNAGWVYLLSSGDGAKGIQPGIYRCYFDQ